MIEGIWSTDGIMGKENQRIHRKSCPIATLSTKNPTSTGLKPNPGLCSEKLATNYMNHSMAQK
jgi:hypothetical protein